MLEKLTPEEFNEFSKNHEQGTFFQSTYWGQLKEFTGWTSHIVGIKNSGKVVAATLLLGKKIPVLGKYIYYAPRGFLIDYTNFYLLEKFTNELTKYVKKNKGIFVKINPYVEYRKRDINGNIIDDETNQHIIDKLEHLGFKHNGFTINYGVDLEPRWLSVLNLENETEESLLKNMRQTTRWGINNSYKHGLKLVEIGKDRLDEFKKLMEHTSERRGFIDRSETYYETMYDAFSKDDNIKIMLVELNTKEYLQHLQNQRQETLLKQVETKNNSDGNKSRRILKELDSQLEAINKKMDEINNLYETKGETIVIAGGLFMTFGRQVISLFGASYREYMKYNGQYFLNFKMIKYALNNGYDKFNFYGITGEFDENSEMYGLFNFKRGFNSDVVELIGEFTLITRKFNYKLYQLILKVYRLLKKRVRK